MNFSMLPRSRRNAKYYCYMLPEIPFDTDPEFPLSGVTIFANIWQHIVPEVQPGDPGSSLVLICASIGQIDFETHLPICLFCN